MSPTVLSWFSVARAVPHHAVEEVDPAELLHILDGIGDQTGGEDHEESTDRVEECADVDPFAEAVNRGGDRKCNGQAAGGAGDHP
jgi:hypothetical protein